MRTEKIIFTNGCFDILHAGHLHYLKQSRKLGAKLIVAVNSDESVKRLKGEERPINSLKCRVRALLELPFVDEVFIFDDDTPYQLIQNIRPDIITKGSDYDKDCVIGNDIASVVLIPRKYDISTTTIINNVLEKYIRRN